MQRRRFGREFKIEAVRLIRERGVSVAQAAPAEVAREIVRVVDTPFGQRPFRVHVDPSQDGAEIVNGVADRMRREMYRNIGMVSLLSPTNLA